MADDDDRPSRPPARLTILPLDALGVDELETYVTELRTEIARAEASIARKRSQRTVADAVFGRRSPEGTP